jgi:hypothetical protein
MKIRLVGAELFHANGRVDGRTDRHEETDNLFRNFANAPKTICTFLGYTKINDNL